MVTALKSQLPETHPHEALIAAGQIRDKQMRLKMLATLARRLAGRERKVARRMALEAARDFEDAGIRVSVLAFLGRGGPGRSGRVSSVRRRILPDRSRLMCGGSGH